MTISGNDIYASGYNCINCYNIDLVYNAVYWKNGKQIMLTKSTKISYNIASSIAVSGSDVYVGEVKILWAVSFGKTESLRLSPRALK